MIIRKLGVYFFFFFLSLTVPSLKALEIPKVPQGRVNDYAGMFSPQSIHTLSQTLSTYEANTNKKIVVATFPALGGEGLEDFSRRLSGQWQIGHQDGQNSQNSVLIIIVKNERLIRIKVGKGLSTLLTEDDCYRIIANSIVPHFKNGAYDQGIMEAVQVIINFLQDTGTVPHKGAMVSRDTRLLVMGGIILGCLLLVAGVMLFQSPWYYIDRNGGTGGGFLRSGGEKNCAAAGKCAGGGVSGGWYIIAARGRNNPATFFRKTELEQIVQAIEEVEKKAHIGIKVYLEKTSSLPVIERAWQVFCQLQMDEPAQYDSGLFYFAVKNKLFALVSDGGIQKKVSQDIWEKVGEAIQTNFRQEKFGEGLVKGIRLVGEEFMEQSAT